MTQKSATLWVLLGLSVKLQVWSYNTHWSTESQGLILWYVHEIYFVVETAGSLMQKTSRRAMKLASTQLPIWCALTPFEPS